MEWPLGSCKPPPPPKAPKLLFFKQQGPGDVSWAKLALDYEAYVGLCASCSTCSPVSGTTSSCNYSTSKSSSSSSPPPAPRLPLTPLPWCRKGAGKGGGGADEQPKKETKPKKERRKKDRREQGDRRDMPVHGTAGEVMGAQLKQEVGTLAKEEEGDQELGFEGSVEGIVAAPRT